MIESSETKLSHNFLIDLVYSSVLLRALSKMMSTQQVKSGSLPGQASGFRSTLSGSSMEANSGFLFTGEGVEQWNLLKKKFMTELNVHNCMSIMSLESNPTPTAAQILDGNGNDQPPAGAPFVIPTSAELQVAANVVVDWTRFGYTAVAANIPLPNKRIMYRPGVTIRVGGQDRVIFEDIIPRFTQYPQDLAYEEWELRKAWVERTVRRYRAALDQDPDLNTVQLRLPVLRRVIEEQSELFEADLVDLRKSYLSVCSNFDKQKKYLDDLVANAIKVFHTHMTTHAIGLIEDDLANRRVRAAWIRLCAHYSDDTDHNRPSAYSITTMLDATQYNIDDAFIHFIHDLEHLFDRWRAANNNTELPDPQKMHYLVRSVSHAKLGKFGDAASQHSIAIGMDYARLKQVLLTYEQQYKSSPEWQKRKMNQANAATTQGKGGGGGKKGNKKVNKSSNKGTSSQEGAVAHWCPYCKKLVLHDPNQCWMNATCTFCGKKGHISSRCHEVKKRLLQERKKMIDGAAYSQQSSSNTSSGQGKA